MPDYQISEDVVSALSNPSPYTPFANSDFRYEWAVGGYPFLSAATDRFPEQRGLVALQKDQVDTSADPGEQSLSQWWLRSQRNWTGGAGREFLEPSNDERVMRRFHRSCNIDVSREGRLQLTKQTVPINDVTSSVPWVLRLRRDTDTRVFVGAGFGEYEGRFNSDMTYTPVTVATYPEHLSLAGGIHAVNGKDAWVWSPGNSYIPLDRRNRILRVTLTSAGDTTWTSCYSNVTAKNAPTNQGQALRAPGLWYVKDRLIYAYDNSLYQLAPYTNTGDFSTETPEFTHPDPDWVWTDVAEAPTAILFCGFSGDTGVIYSAGVTDSNGAQTIAQPVVIAEFPTGEFPIKMVTYLGTFVVIGTNKGLRVGTIAENGSIAYGPLVFDLSAVTALHLRGNFVFAGVGPVLYDEDGNYGFPGVIRLDLSDIDQSGFLPWFAEAVLPPEHHWNNSYVGAITDGTEDRLIFLTGATWMSENLDVNDEVMRIYHQTSNKSIKGWLDTAQVRYNVFEPKSFHKLRVTQDGSVTGRVTAQVIRADGQIVSALSYNQTSPLDADVQLAPIVTDTSIGLRFTLYRDSSAPAIGPIVKGFQLKAVPTVRRKQLLRIPLLCFDVERDRHGVTRGKPGDAWVRYSDLRDAVLTGQPLLVQQLSNNESFVAVIDNLEFSQTTPPAQATGFGGVIYITFREL